LSRHLLMKPHRLNRDAIHLIAACVLLTCSSTSFSLENSVPTQLASFEGEGQQALNPAWRLSVLPADKGIAPSRFEPTLVDGVAGLKVSTDASYGVLSHAWQGATPTTLSWRWRVDQPLAGADLSTKAGDDAALKVCVMFDQPTADIPFFQRTGLALARSVTGQALPSATLCYVWDHRYKEGTSGANPYTARVRYIVLGGPDAVLGQWVPQKRRVSEDFQRLFGQESPRTPPVTAVAVGADSDNTRGNSLAYISPLRWLP
jgi:hypothetical protein